MVTDDKVLHQGLQLFGKRRCKLLVDDGNLGVQHLQFDDHVPKQLAARGVGERAGVGNLMNFADVMQKRSGEQQIAVDRGIVFGRHVA